MQKNFVPLHPKTENNEKIIQETKVKVHVTKNHDGRCMILAAATGKAESISVDSSKVYDIDEVIVVSQPKEAFRLRQQPLSSTSFGNFEMNRLGARDLRELSSYIPNFVMPNYGSRLSSQSM